MWGTPVRTFAAGRSCHLRRRSLSGLRLVISELKAVRSRIEQLRGLVRGQVSVAAASPLPVNYCRLLSPSSRRPIPMFVSTSGSARPANWSGTPGRGPGSRSDFDARRAAARRCRHRRHRGARRRCAPWWFPTTRSLSATSSACVIAWRFRWRSPIPRWPDAIQSSKFLHLLRSILIRAWFRTPSKR